MVSPAISYVVILPLVPCIILALRSPASQVSCARDTLSIQICLELSCFETDCLLLGLARPWAGAGVIIMDISGHTAFEGAAMLVGITYKLSMLEAIASLARTI